MQMDSALKFSKQQNIQESQYVFPYHYLNLYDDFYRRFAHRHYLSLLQLVHKCVDIKSGDNILDAGCGDGRFCYEINNDNANITGIDYSDRAIAFAKAFVPKCTFRCADLSTGVTQSFDKVVSIEVMEHIPLNEVNNFAKSLVACVKIGGLIIISVPSCNIPVTKKHYQHFSPKNIIDIFSPWCELIEITGHIQVQKWRSWERIVKIVRIIWPLKNRIPFSEILFNLLESKFDKIRLVSPEEGVNIVAVFRRNNNPL